MWKHLSGGDSELTRLMRRAIQHQRSEARAAFNWASESSTKSRSTSTRPAGVNALVDGELVEHNMFPRVRAGIIALIAILLLVVLALTIGLILASKLFNA